MNTEKIEQLEKDTARMVKELQDKWSEEHTAFAKDVMDRVKDEVIPLSEDEVRLLETYRTFVARNKPGSRFKWFTPTGPELVVAPEPRLLVDPRESDEYAEIRSELEAIRKDIDQSAPEPRLLVDPKLSQNWYYRKDVVGS